MGRIDAQTVGWAEGTRLKMDASGRWEDVPACWVEPPKRVDSGRDMWSDCQRIAGGRRPAEGVQSAENHWLLGIVNDEAAAGLGTIP